MGKPGIASKPLKGCLYLAEEGLAGGHEVVCGFLETGGDSLFTLGEVGTGIVVLLVAHFTVNLEHSVDVFAHVGDDRTGEGVLRIGVDVHLDYAVGNGFADVGEFGTGTAVEDEGHAGRFAVLGDHGFLAVAQDAGLQLDVAGLVHAVHVAEGGGQHEFAEGGQGFIRHQHVFRRGVELVSGVAGVVHAVFFAAHDADFNFKDDAQFGAFLQQFTGKLEVFSHGQRGGVQHVGVEEGGFTAFHAAAGFGDQGTQEGVHVFGLAVVRVQGYKHVVLFSQAARGFRQNNGAKGGTADGGAGGEFAAADGNLDDAVALGFGEGAEGAVDHFDRGHVDGRIGIAFLLGRFKHGNVLFWCGYWHNGDMIGVFFREGKAELRRAQGLQNSCGTWSFADHFRLRLRRFSGVRPVVDALRVQEGLVPVQAFLEVCEVLAARLRPAQLRDGEHARKYHVLPFGQCGHVFAPAASLHAQDVFFLFRGEPLRNGIHVIDFLQRKK